MSHVIRMFESMEEYRACVALQDETWGPGFSERVPPVVMKVAQILGGVAAGAFREDGTLDGFVFGMTGPRDGVVVHWSDMLAVRPGIRDGGMGARLKAYQRQVLLDRGIEVMHWTFDPLQGRNAHLNFAKLGIVVREYVCDMYGSSDSPLHRGIGTDRFVVLWQMASDRVARRLDGESPMVSLAAGAASALEAEPPAASLDPARAAAAQEAEPPGGTADPTEVALDPNEPVPRPGVPSWSDPTKWVEPAASALPGLPRPAPPALGLDAPAIRVAVPSDIVAMMDADMDLAVAWREATRAAFLHYLARGYEVREFFRGPWTSHYVLTQRETNA